MEFPTRGFFQRCFPSPLHQQFQLLDPPLFYKMEFQAPSLVGSVVATLVFLMPSQGSC